MLEIPPNHSQMYFKDSGYLFDTKDIPNRNLFGGRTPVPLKVFNSKIVFAVGCYESRKSTAIGLGTLNITEDGDDLKFACDINSFQYPWIPRGALGTYSDHGIIPSCAIKLNKKSYALYTIGFDSKNATIFSASSGLVILNEDLSVAKIYEGPILERGPDDPYWAASPYVIKIASNYHMLYTSAIGYKNSGEDKILHHQYVIKSKKSLSHLYFPTESHLFINKESNNEYAIARPSVINHKGTYHLFYCKRETSYSKDYQIFCRSNENFSLLNLSPEKHVNISNLVDNNFINCKCYPYPFTHNGKLYVLYNGRDYGKTGFRIAVFNQ